ncbi:MAG: F0F1 ATP synthase subunit A [Candidatus Omnitrophota bacterium]|nr:F0F1 ATP synthase subunit A [Candidatus Omnitrophota bacterium]
MADPIHHETTHATGAIHEAVHEVVQHAAEHHEAHELPNWITLLNDHFDTGWTHFLHQWENVIFSGAIACLISLVAIRAAKKDTLIPMGIRNFVEVLFEAIEAFVTGILGPHGTKHAPFLGTLFFYVLLQNWLGLVPFMKSPTSAWSTTVAIALVTMVYVQITGIREQGVWHYLKHLAGNPQNIFGIILIPLMLVINLILELGAVPFSLSLRLFANISSEDRLLLNFAQLTLGSPFYIGFFFQLFGNMLAIIFSLVQAFVFMLLSTVYISLVLPHEDHEHEAETAPAH